MNFKTYSFHLEALSGWYKYFWFALLISALSVSGFGDEQDVYDTDNVLSCIFQNPVHPDSDNEYQRAQGFHYLVNSFSLETPFSKLSRL